ncbi:hypothetical protein PRZ48_005340 [Zasmidium cellare]|uniref:3-hydroxy-3-methylglutaryl coenzyme A reductase n=1 Tax=Zasmidium cellare TaxID=395010 RepID=A0ABR0ES30_ZASCE|nr:hypothetical protein PRZ48_005340 [Zasmidium cellare]
MSGFRAAEMRADRMLISTLQALSWPACIWPIYTVSVVALLACQSYIGCLSTGQLHVTGQRGTSDAGSFIASRELVREGNFTNGGAISCAIERPTETLTRNMDATLISQLLEELDPNQCDVTSSSWNKSAALLDTASTGLSGQGRVNGTQLSTLQVDSRHTNGFPAHESRNAKRSEEPLAAHDEGRQKDYAAVYGSVLQLITPDLPITVVQWIALHVTVASLFLSMRRLGSNFWLAIGVIMSSTYAFSFALLLTTRTGLSVDTKLLLEGLPVFVTVVGFSKHLNLAKSVLQAGSPESKSRGREDVKPTSRDTVRKAIGKTGLQIIKRYMIEIVSTVAGCFLTLDTKGGLYNFCVLAAWMLLFDCLLLFTFFTSLLMVKIEIARTRRHIDVKDNLEEEGISDEVARSVASRIAPMSGDHSKKTGPHEAVLKLSHFTIFKAVATAMFVGITILSLHTIPSTKAQPLTQHNRNYQPRHINHNQEYKIANLDAADLSGLPTIGGFLRSLEHPLLGKWMICALALSVAFNGYLFKAATSVSTQPPLSNRQVIDERSLFNAEHFTATDVSLNKSAQPQTRPDLPSDERWHHASNSKDLRNPGSDRELCVQRSPENITQMLKDGRFSEMADEEIVNLALDGKISSHALEKVLKDHSRAVKSQLPYREYNYSDVFGACCENVIGYMPVPLGVAGPLVIDDQSYYIPMATTEGVLIASTSRGCKAINAAGGATTILTGDGMTRGPCVRFETLKRAGDAIDWLHSDTGKAVMKRAFDTTSRFARLESMKAVLAGPEVFIRFKTTTGDAMGMNMVSKGVDQALTAMRREGFDDMRIVSLSGNYCSDKKAAAVNWIEGRGKSVVAEAIIPAEVVSTVLKTSVGDLVDFNTSKNLVGSAMAGSLGGFNAHAANIVAAIYIATGQDPAQVVESASCITTMRNLGGALQICVSMPSVEVGTLGGGTILEPQGAMLQMLGVRGPHASTPGANARRLARIVAATTLAGELSLCSALSAGHLVQAHMQHNRGRK